MGNNIAITQNLPVAKQKMVQVGSSSFPFLPGPKVVQFFLAKSRIWAFLDVLGIWWAVGSVMKPL